jgi:hypothetical protein
MEMYFRLSGKDYRAPYSVIVGRGGPFTQLNTNRAVSRAHFILSTDNGKWFIRRFGHQTSVNDVPFPQGQTVEITPSDVVSFAGETLQVLPGPTGPDMETIRSSKSFSTLPELAIRSAVLVLLLFSLWLVFWVTKGDLAWRFFLTFAGISLLGLGVVHLILRFAIKTLFPPIASIIFGEKGFTVHWANGETMTFEVEKILTWSSFQRAIRISQYDRKFFIPPEKEGNLLESYLKTHALDRQISHVPITEISVGLLVLGLLVYFY